MEIRLQVHVEVADGAVCWWAESDELPGFTAAAPTLVEMRERAHAAINELVENARVVEDFCAPADDAEPPEAAATLDGGPAAASTHGIPARRSELLFA